MKLLAMEKDVKPLPADNRSAVLKREASAVWELQQRSVIREIYLTNGKTSAVVVLECEDEAVAARILGTLPLVREGYIEFQIYRLDPYPGFSRLFGPE